MSGGRGAGPVQAAAREAAPAQRNGAALPLCVDLDGTLVRTDTLVEGLLALAAGLRLGPILGALAGGRAALKARVARAAPPDPALLPYNAALLDYLRAQRAAGRRIVLATAADETVARRVADHLGLFDEVIASTAARNLKGAAKAEALVARFGRGGFAYAGDARADLAVWDCAGAAVLVDVAPGVARRVRVPVERRIATRPPLGPTLLRAMRPHQWVKNLLVFVPILTAHALLDGPSWLGGLLAFAAFCAAASGVYLLNDLMDLAADRVHPAKRHRPFAAGAAPLGWGIGLGAILLALAVALGAVAGIAAVVGLYAASSTAYSLHLKRLPLVDVFMLAGLFTVRLAGGGAATGHPLSLWLLAFAGFLFLSLALVKRVAELRETRAGGGVAGRGYGPADLATLQQFGVAAAFASALVLALYVQNEAQSGRFSSPGVLWGIVPLVLLWNCRLWLATARGYMHHDPILYAVRDRVTWAICGAVVLVMLAAQAGVPAWLGGGWAAG